MQALASADEIDRNLRTGSRPDLADHLVPQGHWTSLDRHDRVAVLQSACRCGAAVDDASDHRRHGRLVGHESQDRQEIGVECIAVDRSEIEMPFIDLALQRLGLDRDGAPLHDVLEQTPAQLLPCAYFLARNTGDEFSRRDMRHGGRRVRGGVANGRPHPGYAVHEHHPVQQDRQQEVRDRSGGDDCRPPPDVLPIECAMQFRSGDRTFALVEHLHVSAEREGADGPLRPVAA